MRMIRFTYLAIVVLTWVRARSMYWSIWVWKEKRMGEKVSVGLGKGFLLKTSKESLWNIDTITEN